MHARRDADLHNPEFIAADQNGNLFVASNDGTITGIPKQVEVSRNPERGQSVIKGLLSRAWSRRADADLRFTPLIRRRCGRLLATHHQPDRS
jgi:hypothetical protein